MYLAWYDDNAKRAIEDKIRDGMHAYRERLRQAPRSS